MRRRLFAKLLQRLKPEREPDYIIGGAETPYMNRWYLVPRNRWCNVYLHQILRDDDDRALHDHPWPSVSLILSGGYWEWRKNPTGPRWCRPGSIIIRGPRFAHRLELSLLTGECWTLFITGPKVREWGFHCPQGWVPWHQFVSRDDSGQIGRGCDQ